MKARKKFTQIITIRMTDEEKNKVEEVAEISGLTLSEVLRRKFSNMGIRSKVSMVLVNELRRQGGLLKSNFNTLREVNSDPIRIKDLLVKQEDLLRDMKHLIEQISKEYGNEK